MRAKIVAAAIALMAAASTASAIPGDQESFNRGLAAYDAGRYEEAYEIFYVLAAKDDLAAMRNIALMLRRGQGVERDLKEAMHWYERAALAGLVTAQADLAVMLLDGEAGDPDPEAAMEWLMPAAAAGHPTAQYRLGLLYENGADFMAGDVEAAKKMSGAAAARGQRDAAARLADLLGLKDPRPSAPAGRSARGSDDRSKAAPGTPPPLRTTTDPKDAATHDAKSSEGGMRKTFVGPPLNPLD
jgi:TPR repeat protein